VTKRLLLVAALAAAPLGVARAQGADQCVVAITPAAGRSIPANAPALHYVLFATGANVPPEAFQPPQGIELFNGAGAGVPVTINADPFYGYEIDPATPFVAGQTYRLRYPDPCAGSGTISEQTIAIGPAAPIPTTSGTVTLTAVTGDVPYTCFDLPYVLHNQPGLAIGITPSAELAPFLPVTLFEVVVDALTWSRSAYGGPHTFATLPGIIQHPDDRLYADCGLAGDGDPQNDCPTRAEGLTLGAHRMWINVHILGSTSDPQRLDADFTIDCDTGGSGSAGTGGGGASGSGGTGGTTGSGGGCGCRAGGWSPPGSAGLLIIVVVAGAMRRRFTSGAPWRR